VDTLDVSTVVYLPREEVYEFLLDFPGYAEYSEYLDEIRQYGDGTPGTEYELTFAWWKLSYTARSKVTNTAAPDRIEWELVKDLDASGYWQVEPASAPDGVETASRVHFVVNFRPGSADSGVIDLPSFVSFDWLVGKVTPKIRAEAERVIRRVVQDLEGESREVALEIHETPSSV